MTSGSDEMVRRPHTGRVYERDQVVRLGDVGPDGGLRLDALARWLQDIATDDRVDASGNDAAVSDAAGAGFSRPGSASDGSTWVLRRNVVSLEARPRFVGRVRLSTWCSGIGARWAERRTDVAIDGDVVISSAALWVHLDPLTLRPTPLPSRFYERWAEAAGGRKVSARLSHPAPPDDVEVGEWRLRASDYDVLGHVNNAIYWQVLIDALGTGASNLVRAEVEFRAGIAERNALITRKRTNGSVTQVWCCVDGEVRASLVGHSEC